MPLDDQALLDMADGKIDDAVGEDFGDEVEGQVEQDTAGEAQAPVGEPEGEGQQPAGEPEGKVEEPAGEGEQQAAEPEGEIETVAKPQGEPRIPKSRFDSVRRRLREAEAENEKLREQKAKEAAENPPEQPSPVDYDGQLAALAKEQAQATLDGEVEKMAEINQKMMKVQQEQFQAMLQQSETGAISKSQDAMITNNLVDDLIADNARLNPDSDKFDQVLVTRMNDMRDFYEYQGLSESAALVKAVETLMPEAFEPQADPNAAKQEQTTAALRKKVAAAAAQPPNAATTGEDAPAYGQGEHLVASKLTLEDLDRVTDAQWDEMLGNNL